MAVSGMGRNLTALETIDRRIENGREWIKELEQAKEKLKNSTIKKGDFAWHSSFKNCLVLDVYFEDGQMRDGPKGVVARIAHSKSRDGDTGIEILPIDDLLPYNESVKVLHE